MTGAEVDVGVARRSSMKAHVSKIAGIAALKFATTTLPIELQGRERILQAYAFQGDVESEQGLALVHRDASKASEAAPIVHFHSGCVTGDVFHSLRCDCQRQLRTALRQICRVPHGVLIYLPYHEGRGAGLFKKLQAYASQDGSGELSEDADAISGSDTRDYSLAASALVQLGIIEIQLLSNSATLEKILAQLGLSVVSVKTL